MSKQTVTIRPLSGAIGAEILGVDVSQPLDDDVFSQIQDAFDQYLVIFFRDQDLTPEAHNNFAGRFYELAPHPYVHSIEGYPGIIEIVKESDETINWGGTGLHADLTFLERPPRGAMLYAREIPPTGGDTLFVNLYLVYESLSSGMRRMLGGLESFHQSLPVEEYSAPYKGMFPKPASVGSTVHPLVITHPRTGRRSLYLNPQLLRRFSGMTGAESRPILDYLIGQAKRPEFSCRFRWKKGSIAVWDNRVALHCALNDDFQISRGETGYRRVMHRATFSGERPVSIRSADEQHLGV